MGKAPLTASQRRNRRVGVICAGVFLGMVGAAYASVPLYRAFCQLTGFDGTVRKAAAAPGKVLDQTVQVRFDANVRGMPWTFTPEQVSQTVKIGDTALAFYRVTNTGAAPVTGRAAYNVVPEAAGAYFQKLECFCFRDQTLQPGQTMVFPVVYFIDPRWVTDRETMNQPQVTLSYTFYPQALDPNGDARPVDLRGGGAKTAGTAATPRG